MDGSELRGGPQSPSQLSPSSTSFSSNSVVDSRVDVFFGGSVYKTGW